MKLLADTSQPSALRVGNAPKFLTLPRLKRLGFIANVDSENGFGALLRTEYACNVSACLTDVTVVFND